ncbi:MAG: hypothetical protein EOP39_29815, partial [Rubrivivax sp.]
MRTGRSLFLRFFLAFAGVMLGLWLLVLAAQALLVQRHFERVQQAEVKGWAGQIAAAVRVSAARPDELRRTVHD